jgi:hypothetical protein
MRCRELEKRCYYLDSEVDKLKEDGIKNERYRKRLNLIFQGVEENDHKYPQGTLGSIGKILVEKMSIGAEDVNVIRCYRIGRLDAKLPKSAKGERKPRPVLVCLNTDADRNKIWEKKKDLKGSDYFVEEDYPEEVKRRRSLLYPIMKLARSIDTYQSAYLSGEYLVIDKKRYTEKTMKDLPPDLNPINTSTKVINKVTYFFTKNSPLSNHFKASFSLGTDTYNCSEQRYFARKALLWGDESRYREIMAAQEPHKILDAGKRIVNYSEENWDTVAEYEMKEAIRGKFTQNEALKKFLLDTAGTEIAEASYNETWGIGTSLKLAGTENRQLWSHNLMGKCLMELRQDFQDTTKALPPPPQLPLPEKVMTN